MSKPHIVIIGAGAAGIAAAAKLFENGYDNLILLEAEDRIGGRIKSVPFQGGIVDVGAQWCHGEEDNIVYNIAKDLDLLSPSLYSYDNVTLYEASGKVVDKKLSERLLEIALSIGDDSASVELANGSFGEFFINRYNKEIKEEFANNNDDYKIATYLIPWYQKVVTMLDSAPTWFDISAKLFQLYKHCNGNNYLNWRDRGYIKILHVLMKIYPDPSEALPFEHKILYNKEVNKILWKGDLATVNCTDGTVYNADHVIVTVSLGVLKKNYKTLFEPELPIVKQNAIKYMGFGCVTKILLYFPNKWWPNDCLEFNLLWTKEDSENILSDFPHGPSYNGQSWLQDVVGFFVVDDFPTVLMAWIVGTHIADIESLPDDILSNGCMFLLKKFLGNMYDIPQPNDILCSRWKNDPHFYGTYSYQSVEAEKHNIVSANLADPLTANNNDVVLFAGEATHPHYFSTVHGAIETGFREANRIINYYWSTRHIQLKGKL